MAFDDPVALSWCFIHVTFHLTRDTHWESYRLLLQPQTREFEVELQKDDGTNKKTKEF